MIALFALFAQELSGETTGILVVTVTKGFRHDSIPAAETALGELAESGGIRVDFARTDAELGSMMAAEHLRRYGLVIFANTSGELPLPDRDAFLAWVRDGGAFLGVHSASDTFHGWPEYVRMLGGEFLTHGPMTTVRCDVDEPGHPAVGHLHPSFVVFEEIYEFRRLDHAGNHDLLHLDLHPQSGAPGRFPLAWWKRYGEGRILYTAFGHREETWRSVWFRAHLTGAIRFLLDDEQRRRPVKR
ncbi:MAG: ThuA domain-containing protein [Thermoanaerobaculia bacterium]|nr:ThuA domain-containing protein [Thermoanaerobaculia bacterium]